MNKIIFSYFLHQFTMNKFIFRLILHQFNFFWIILSSTGCSVDGSRARTNWGVGHGPTGLWGTSQRCCGARANYGGHGPTKGDMDQLKRARANLRVSEIFLYHHALLSKITKMLKIHTLKLR